MIVSFAPILLIDLVGSILMIVFSFLCLRLVNRLRRRDNDNIIWAYLFWICLGLAAFAVSRSAGHILKNILILTEHKAAWEVVRPFSGGINTITFVLVGSVTLFFERIWKMYQLVLKDRQALRAAHEELLFLNQNLEKLVAERTAAFQASEYKYRQVFEVSKDMIMVTDRDGRILNLNPAGYQMLEIEPGPQALKDRSASDFFANDQDWPSMLQTIWEQESIASLEIDLRPATGAHKRTLLSAGLARGSAMEGDTIHFLIKDIEGRREMEEQLAQADKLASIGELSSGVAHEINNPLGIILGYTQLLLRAEKPPSPRYADLKTIEKHARSCKAIVEDLLSFARTSKPQKETADLHQIIDDVLHFVQHHSGLEKIDIGKHFDPDLKPFVLDEKKIKQVVMNLVMNARHAVGKAGKIEVSTRLNARKMRAFIQVRDSGHGIERQNLSRIFDPFFTTKPTGEGTGLGLSVSYGIIKSHGGDISVVSEPGMGSVFTVELPVAPFPGR